MNVKVCFCIHFFMHNPMQCEILSHRKYAAEVSHCARCARSVIIHTTIAYMPIKTGVGVNCNRAASRGRGGQAIQSGESIESMVE